jgi:hypothetical protein
MPSKEDIAKIQVAFATQYGLDLAGIHKDTETLRTLVAEIPINSNQINNSCYTYDGTQAFVPNLETTAFFQIDLDPRLNPRRIELNLDEARKYLQSCLQIRLQYGDIARLRNDTRFKGEEFVRLDEVHLQEVEADLYKLPWQEADAEIVGLKSAIKQASVQQSIPEEMKKDGATSKKYSALLSSEKMSEDINNNAFITKHVANSLQDQVGDKATLTAEYRNYIELASWEAILASSKATLAQLNAKLVVAQAQSTYFHKDEGFKTQRSAISRQIAWLQIAEHCRIGSELNYNDKLKNLKALFDENLRCLIERAIVLTRGLKQTYGVDVPLTTPATGSILDDLSIWLIKVSDELSKFKRTQKLTIALKWNSVTISLGARDNNGLNPFSTEFILDDADLPSSNALLRGIGFEYVGTNQLPITLKVAVPQSAWSGGETGPLVFGRVCPVAPSLELRPQHSDPLWNGSAKGNWKIEGMFDQAAGSIDKLVMYIWVVSV